MSDSAISRSAIQSMFDPKLLKPAIADSFKKLAPQIQWRNPVMFVVYLGSILTTLLLVQALFGKADASAGFIALVSIWLWFTVLFANFAEAMAEGRSKAQAASLRSAKKNVVAKKLATVPLDSNPRDSAVSLTDSSSLRKGDILLIEAGDMIPADGEVIDGIASVNEAAITGESAPVIRESGGDFSAVTGGTQVLSDWIVVRVSVNPGEAFLDRMIAMVEGAKRQKTPNEIALTILLVALTIVFLLVTVTLLPFSLFGVNAAGAGSAPSITVLVSLLVCLIPTTIAGLLSAIGVAGMSRMMQANVIATSGRAVEAAGDVNVLLLDKTGTITLGNRQASAFVAAAGSFLFVEQALAGPDTKRWFTWLMKGGAALTLFFALCFSLDLINTHQVTAIVGTLGLAPSLLGLPGAIKRARRGDSVGYYLLVAWAVYFASTAILIEVIKGRLGVNFWTLHSFQFGATLDMLLFMRVLGLRTKALQSEVQRTARERDNFHSLAFTDPLTGLANRRSLNTSISVALDAADQTHILAVYMMDLDGFKQVNDQFGHDVGDELLVAVAHRLKSTLRSSDVVARLGGDEFLVMSNGLSNDQQAHEIGEKLLAAFTAPFALSTQSCQVGVTVGYALAPQDGQTGAQLLKRADAAMYAGKAEGKNCLRRATA